MRPFSRYAKWVGQLSRPSKMCVACGVACPSHELINFRRQPHAWQDGEDCGMSNTAWTCCGPQDARSGTQVVPAGMLWSSAGGGETYRTCGSGQPSPHIDDGGPPLRALLLEELQQVQAAHHIHVHRDLVQQQHLLGKAERGPRVVVFILIFYFPFNSYFCIICRTVPKGAQTYSVAKDRPSWRAFRFQMQSLHNQLLQRMRASG